MIPPFNGITIVLAVAAIELSAYLLAINAILLLLTLWLGGRRRVPAAIVLAANCIVCALPSLALRGTGVDAPVSYRDVNVPITERTIPVTLGSERSKIRAYLPIVPSRTPAIFAMYGGAWRNGGPRNDATLNRGLAHHGYAVFALDYRHAPKYRFPAALDDVRSEIALILKNTSRYNIDPQRTAVLGHSSGGQLAALTAFEPRSRIRALIIYSGAIDLAMGWKYPPTPDPIGVRRIIEQYIGEPPAAAPERYRAANAFELIRPGLPPALLIYGARDHVVAVHFGWTFRDALRAAGTRVTYVQLPWTEHAFEEIPFGLHAPIAYRATLNFLGATLPTRPPP